MAISRVVMVKARGILSSDGAVDSRRVRRALETGLQAVAEASRIRGAVENLFSRSDKVGIKINAIAGRNLSTRPETSLALAGILTEAGLPSRNVFVWDRSNRELREAGYRLNAALDGPRVLATDTNGLGYETELVSRNNIGSLFSKILSRQVTASVSLALLKDHGLAGITASLKNYFGAVHNPNKYHDTGCDPYVAELFDCPQVKSRHRLSILDCLVVQFHRGPSYHARWAERLETLVFSLDPVAADSTGLALIERLRAKAGLPSLKEESREPAYLRTAEKMGLGQARKDNIRLIELEA